jgi:hypothetical protein
MEQIRCALDGLHDNLTEGVSVDDAVQRYTKPMEGSSFVRKCRICLTRLVHVADETELLNPNHCPRHPDGKLFRQVGDQLADLKE